MAAEILKRKARDEFKISAETETNTKFDSLNDRQRSIAMTKFYVREIHNPKKTHISDDDLSEGIVDGANDLGCDFIHRDDGHITIIQSKYRKEPTAEKAEDITHFLSILKRFKDGTYKTNKYLIDVLSEINWDNDTFELLFLTFGKIDGQAKINAESAPHYPDGVKDIEQRCEWKFLDENDLNIELRSSIELAKQDYSKTIKIYPVGEKRKKGLSVIQITAGEYKSYIMTTDAKQLIGAYKQLGRDALFSLNIRNFIGNTKTNQAIIKTAKDEAAHFFLYNNGISCLASKISASDDALEVTGLQVINGAQTVKALVNLARNHKQLDELWNKEAPTILVRITEVPENYGNSAPVRVKITQCNNTQNTIKDSDFRSNDDVQRNLVKQFGELNRNGKSVLYMPKRTDKPKPNSEIIRLEEFAKSVYAFLYNPTEFSGSTSFLFNTDSSGGYTKVFGDGTNQWEKMPDDEYRLRAGIYWITQEFSIRLRKIREEEEDSDARMALERKWLLLYAAKEVFVYFYKDDAWKNQIRKLYKADWNLNDCKKGVILLKIFNAAKSGVITAYKNNKKFNKDTFVHRNWMRGKNTPTEIREMLRDTVLPNIDKIDDIPA